MVKVSVNGDSLELPENFSIGQYLDDNQLDRARVVIELNGEIIDKEELYKTTLSAGDTLEIATLVGGGANVEI